jgi:endoglucanase
LVAGTLVALGASAASGGSPRAQAARSCSFSRYPATRDPSNPLALPKPPGGNPLNGARFFVDGPAKGPAARAIASMLGIDPDTLPVSESWAAFKRSLQSGRFSRMLKGKSHGWRRYAVHELEKIADQPEALRFSRQAGGGTPEGTYEQVQKILCDNLTADPGAVPIISTYFLWAWAATSPYPTASDVAAVSPDFRAQIDAVARGTGRHPVVFLLELDALGASAGMDAATKAMWEDDLRYEINTLAALPHTVIYVEGGYSDVNSPSYTAGMLSAIGTSNIRGFFTNDTHQNWTIDEIRWAERISRFTHGLHYIVNTAQNGNGPKLNPHPFYQGYADLCNPPGRALGPPDTTHTQGRGAHDPHADAFLWTHPPGNSSGCGGGPKAGFWAARGIQLAAHANARLGPSPPWSSKPY